MIFSVNSGEIEIVIENLDDIEGFTLFTNMLGFHVRSNTKSYLSPNESVWYLEKQIQQIDNLELKHYGLSAAIWWMVPYNYKCKACKGFLMSGEDEDFHFGQAKTDWIHHPVHIEKQMISEQSIFLPRQQGCSKTGVFIVAHNEVPATWVHVVGVA